MLKAHEDYREVKVSRSSLLTDEIIHQLDGVLNFASPGEFRDTLIEIYHVYILREHQMLPGNFNDMAGQLYVLIDFFKMMENGINSGRADGK
jgi:hypothetical protein